MSADSYYWWGTLHCGLGAQIQDCVNQLLNQKTAIALQSRENPPFHFFPEEFWAARCQIPTDTKTWVKSQIDMALHELNAQGVLQKSFRFGLFVATSGGFSFDREKSFTSDYLNFSQPNFAPSLHNDSPFHLSQFLRDYVKETHGIIFNRSNTSVSSCSAGQHAMHQAHLALNSGSIDFAICLGMDRVQLINLSGFRDLLIYSSSPCAPFDARRNGISLGDACATIILSKKAPPKERQLRIKSSITLTDFTHLTAPSAGGKCITDACAQALQKAQLLPLQLTLIKSHGTATIENDNSEIKGIKALFKSGEKRGNPLPPVLGFKGAIGHTLAASAITEMVLLKACLDRGVIPPTVGFQTPDPELDFFSPTTSPIPLDSKQNILFNSFGFGGANAAMVLEYE